MDTNKLTDDDRQAIIESHDPDWADHFQVWDDAWNFYMKNGREGLEHTIKDYKR